MGLMVETVKVHERVMKRWSRERTELGWNARKHIFGGKRAKKVKEKKRKKND